MDYLVINKARFNHHLDVDIRKSPRGVINWFVDDKDFLNVLLSIQGVNYIYRVHKDEQNDILKMSLKPQDQVLGVLSLDEPKKSIPPPVLRFEDSIFNLVEQNKW